MRLALFIFTMSLTTATIATASPLERINRETGGAHDAFMICNLSNT